VSIRFEVAQTLSNLAKLTPANQAQNSRLLPPSLFLPSLNVFEWLSFEYKQVQVTRWRAGAKVENFVASKKSASTRGICTKQLKNLDIHSTYELVQAKFIIRGENGVER